MGVIGVQTLATAMIVKKMLKTEVRWSKKLRRPSRWFTQRQIGVKEDNLLCLLLRMSCLSPSALHFRKYIAMKRALLVEMCVIYWRCYSLGSGNDIVWFWAESAYLYAICALFNVFSRSWKACRFLKQVYYIFPIAEMGRQFPYQQLLNVM